MSTPTSLRLSDEVRARIKVLATRYGSSEASITRMAVERGLAELELLLAIPSPAEKD